MTFNLLNKIIIYSKYTVMDQWAKSGGLTKAVNRVKKEQYQRYRRPAVVGKSVRVAKYMNKKDVRYLKRNLVTLGEKDYFYTFATNQAINTTHTIYALSDVTQGLGDSQRVGDQIQVRSLEVLYSINFPATLPDGSNIIRVIIFQYLDNVIVPTPAGVMLDVTNNVWLSPYTHDNRFNFRILYDKLEAISLEGPSNVARHIRINKGFLSKIQFSAATTNGTNKIFMIVVSNSNATGDPAFNYSSKLNYSDY